MSKRNRPICVHFQRGYCSWGNSCRNVHTRFSSHSARHQFGDHSFSDSRYSPDAHQHYGPQHRNYHHHRSNPMLNGHGGSGRRPHYNPYHRHQSYRYQQREPPYRPQSFEQHPDRSSTYSSLFPTKRESRIHSHIDPAKETLIFDIDGTVADIENRLALAPGSGTDGTRNHKDWNIVLSGDNYKHDRVVPAAWAYLKYIESLNKYNILYLSGRRSKSLNASMQWLFTENQVLCVFRNESRKME